MDIARIDLRNMPDNMVANIRTAVAALRTVQAWSVANPTQSTRHNPHMAAHRAADRNAWGTSAIVWGCGMCGRVSPDLSEIGPWTDCCHAARLFIDTIPAHVARLAVYA